MMFARALCVALMLLVFGGVSEALAQAKVPKVKITRQPASVVAELGQTVQFSVSYSSTTPVTFQWRLNKQPLEGETAATLVIDQAIPDAAGSYDVVLTNGGGATASKAATLAVNIAPPSLAVDDILDGSFTLRIAGESIDSDGAFVVTGTKTLQDPEAPADTYTFTYKRLPKNKAALIIKGKFYDSELGGYVTSEETHNLTFTGFAQDGRLLANDSVKGSMLPPKPYPQKKLSFTGTGVIAFETAVSPDLAYGAVSGGTLVLGGGSTIMNSSSAGLIKQGSGTSVSLVPGDGQGANEGAIIITSTTINLSNITFNAGVNVQLGAPNFGDPVTGSVNFIPSLNGLTLINGTVPNFIDVGNAPSVLVIGESIVEGGSFFTPPIVP